MYSCFVHLLYLYRLSWANVIKWKGSLRSPSLFTPDFIVVVLSIYIRRELIKWKVLHVKPMTWPVLAAMNTNRSGLANSKTDFRDPFAF